MRRGRTFEKAAAFFALAAEKEPTNPIYPLALGCAWASRAAAIARAATFTHLLREARASYENDVKKWEKMKAESVAQYPSVFTEETFALTKPVLSPDRDFLIKDDNIPFRLTRAVLDSRLSELAQKANQAWETGVALAKTPTGKAEAYYLQGWGMHLLREYLDTTPPADEDESEPNEGEGKDPKPAVPFTVKSLPDTKVIRTLFEKATVAAPEDFIYWQALGDFLRETDAATTAYRKAADLAPHNSANLWYLLYFRSAANAYSKPLKEWPDVQEILHTAQASDRGNAWPLYEEAAILFRYAPYSLTGPSENRNATPAEKQAHRDAVRNAEARKNGRRAIDLLEQGNAAARFEPPRYVDSVPFLLSVAWRYRNTITANLGAMARVRELARSGVGYAQFQTEFENNKAEGVRAARAVIGMGNRMTADWPLEETLGRATTMIDTLVGIAITTIGYKGLQTVYEKSGDTAGAAAVKAENEVFQQTVKDYKKAITGLLNNTEFDAY